MKKLMVPMLVFVASVFAANQPSQKDVKTSAAQTKVEAEQTQGEPFATRMLLVFIDDSEKETGAITKGLALARSQMPAVILTSKHILMNLLKSGVTFWDKLWSIRQTDTPHLLLLIPKTKSLKQFAATPLEYLTNKDQISGLEYKFGLKLEHMPEITTDELLKAEASEKAADSKDYFLPAFKELFVTRKEYTNIGREVSGMPRWAFYFDGHGGIGTTTAGLPVDQFKEILAFVESKIVTVFFGYSSCHAMGTTSKAIYGEIFGKPAGRPYSFTIASDGFVEDLTYHAPDAAFNKAVALLTTPGPIEFPKLLAALFGEGEKNRFSYLRLPGREWFSPQDVDDASFSIGAVMAQTRTEPLRLREVFAGKYGKKALLLYAPIIPFPIEVDVNDPYFNAPILVGMTTLGIYFFESISLADIDILTYCLRVATTVPTGHRRVFWFKKISSNVKSVLEVNAKEPNGGEEFENVIIDIEGTTDPENTSTKHKHTIYLTKDGVQYRLDGTTLHPEEYVGRYAQERYGGMLLSRIAELYREKYEPLKRVITSKRLAPAAKDKKNAQQLVENAKQAIAFELKQALSGDKNNPHFKVIRMQLLSLNKAAIDTRVRDKDAAQSEIIKKSVTELIRKLFDDATAVIRQIKVDNLPAVSSNLNLIEELMRLFAYHEPQWINLREDKELHKFIAERIAEIHQTLIKFVQAHAKTKFDVEKLHPWFGVINGYPELGLFTEDVHKVVSPKFWQLLESAKAPEKPK